MTRSTGRILTTHVGSLPRPASLLDLMKTGERGHELDSAVTQAVDAAVRQQIAHDVDVVTDGEQGKGSFFGYVAERLTGFEPRPGARAELWSAFVLRTDVMHSFRQSRCSTPSSPMSSWTSRCCGDRPCGCSTNSGTAFPARPDGTSRTWPAERCRRRVGLVDRCRDLAPVHRQDQGIPSCSALITAGRIRPE